MCICNIFKLSIRMSSFRHLRIDSTGVRDPDTNIQMQVIRAELCTLHHIFHSIRCSLYFSLPTLAHIYFAVNGIFVNSDLKSITIQFSTTSPSHHLLYLNVVQQGEAMTWWWWSCNAFCLITRLAGWRKKKMERIEVVATMRAIIITVALE